MEYMIKWIKVFRIWNKSSVLISFSNIQKFVNIRNSKL